MTGRKIIGIGMGPEVKTVLTSACRADIPYDIVCYSRPGAGSVPAGNSHVSIAESSDPDRALVYDLKSGKIAAAVRGNLPGEVTLALLADSAGVSQLERVALLETAGKKKFMFAPVGIAEGWTIKEKLALIQKGRVLAKKFGLPEKVGVLSGGRFGGVGWNPVVDRTMADAELVARLGNAEHFEFRIEDAIESCGLIIAPDGITGNYVFRTLEHLGAGRGHGAIVVNIDRIFVDTSRSQKDYSNALRLAAALIG
jgi:putative methanogen marker protein 4